MDWSVAMKVGSLLFEMSSMSKQIILMVEEMASSNMRRLLGLVTLHLLDGRSPLQPLKLCS